MPRIETAQAMPPNLVELCRHQRFEPGVAAPAEQSAPSRPDRVEISDRARWMDQLRKLPSVREELVSRVRAQVKAGTYDVAAKLDAALDRMVDELSLDTSPRRMSA